MSLGALQSPKPEPPRASTKATEATTNSLLTGRDLEQNLSSKGGPICLEQKGREERRRRDNQEQADGFIHVSKDMYMVHT